MGFDVESVIGANCLLNVQHKAAGDKTYANVSSVMPLMKGMPKMAALGYVRETDAQQNGAHEGEPQDDAPPPLTDDDIPFAWLLPLILPALLSASLLA